VLLKEETVKAMKPGSVVVDLAAAQGGNCPLTVADEVVERHGVTLIGHTNLAGMVAADASALYARNVLDFLRLIIDKDGKLAIDRKDDIVAACLMTQSRELELKPELTS
jgi:NAD(P) transhydrogenase subunit alpha